MRRVAHILAALSLTALSAWSCADVPQDSSPVTIFASYANGQRYFKTLADGLKKEHDIDVEFVSFFSSDPSNQIRLELANGNMLADIAFVNFRVPDEHLKDICLDLLSYSDITRSFTYSKLRECMSDDGAVYQLPVTSKLVGITYNATLMEEMGWEPPRNFQDMLELKRKCDRAGVPFATTDLRYTGCGFNYFFNLMGAQWISMMEGTDWLDGFVKGERSVDELKERSGYFKKWVESGLFGDFYAREATAFRAFATSRALFCYTINNQLSRYDGPAYDRNGKKTSRMLGDQYKVIPWISEDGSNNCFTCQDNCWVMVDRSLLAPDKKDKLEKVCTILNYLTQDEFVQFTKNLSHDNYVPLNDFEISEDRMYYDYADEIKAGFTQPRYFDDFCQAASTDTGNEIDSYLLKSRHGGILPPAVAGDIFYVPNPDASYDNIFALLEERQVRRQSVVLGTVKETLDREQTAKIAAISGAMNLQKAIDEAYPDPMEVRVALMPYMTSIRGMQPWHHVGVESAVLYPGPFNAEHMLVLVPNPGQNMLCIRMTGARIKKIVSDGFDPSGFFVYNTQGISTFDLEKYGRYPYACVTKGGFELEDDEEYLVGVSSYSLTPKEYDELSKSGNVVLHSVSDGGPLSADIASGIPMFFEKHPEVGAADIIW